MTDKDAFASNKILGHLPMLVDYLQGNTYPPVLVEVDLTNLCASACPWCAGYLNRKWTDHTLLANGEGQERWESSIAGVKSLIDEMASVGVQAVTWTGGGDPTQHKGLDEVTRCAQDAGLKQAIITHGVIDVSHLIDRLEWIRYSVDAATVDGYAMQHGKPEHFGRVIENIVDAANRKAKENLDVTVGVAFLTSESSWDEIVPFAEMWRDVPVDYIQYRPLLDTHGSKWESDTPEVVRLLREAKEVDSRVTWSEPKYWAIARGENGQTEKCHGIYMETAIAADSKVYTCCHMKGREEFAIGDLTKETFWEIWTRWLEKRDFDVVPLCPGFCRHFGTNCFIESEVLADRQHKDFI